MDAFSGRDWYVGTYREELEVGEGLGGEEGPERGQVVLFRGVQPQKNSTLRI